MTVVNEASAYTKAVLGQVVNKAYTPLVVETKSLFTVSGLVLVTAIVGKVTTAITVANTVKLQHNPTTGTSSDLCAATDLGTTDTPAGNLLSISGAPTGAPVNGIGAAGLFPISKVSSDFLGAAKGIFLSAGVIEQVTATGADGGITWYLTYAPIEDGATVVAA
ncbi:hypothetical protein UK23_29540 [Lentzea aerocolonigenes]|uniref:Uncharacterized protein n=1 Tax=Lentzea aerocolonigenes TaxID=68170 RepID=A0A0F0GLT2_LENAE|nr:hypothetical protein [Lentzea aerocolonigenes]KJK44444.1 hypothetical protein UK23_29540 [Lentzea aerocolonigenes]